MNDSISTYNKINAEVGIKIEPFDVAKRYTKPHKHNKYLEIIYFIKGSGFHHLDMESHSIEPPLLFIVKKDEVHHWEITTKPKGYVIIIKESFLEKTWVIHFHVVSEEPHQLHTGIGGRPKNFEDRYLKLSS